jgi:hypothetical protein
MSTKITKIGEKTHVVNIKTGQDARVFAFGDMPVNTFENLIAVSKNIDWESDPYAFNNVRLVSHGVNNNLPVIIRDIMDQNNLAPGILEREMGLLYGNGPALYKLNYQGGFMVRDYIQDPEIEEWLNSWDHKRYLDMAMVEFKYMKGVYVKRTRNRGPRVGNDGKIIRLEVIPSTDARLEWPEDPKPKRLEYVNSIWVGDFQNHCLHTGMTPYPVYRPNDPFKFGVSVGYHNKYSFGRNFYSVPSYYGSLNWIMRSSDIPEVLRYLSENGITSAFHIHVPEKYWIAKQERLEKNNPTMTDAQLDELLEEAKVELFRKMALVLTGKKNAGKFIETTDFFDEDGNLCKWEITAIDQKVKDFIEAQLKISEKADSATTSGMGLHPSLSNIIVQGKMSGGSEMLYALKLYMASDTTIPEEVVMEPINQAIVANFPGKKGIRLGFYHNTVRKEEDVAPNNRVTNTVTE